MVNQQQTTQTVGAVESLELHNTAYSTPSMKRLLRQLFYMPWRTNAYFNADARKRIEQAVHQAEQGHRGEIKVVVEGCLPLTHAYVQGTRARAQMLFGMLNVWDTEFNSGVLLYLNICERSIEIVADRGISHYVDPAQWQLITRTVVQHIQQGAFAEGVCEGVRLIGEQLQAFYADAGVDQHNELSNRPVFMR